MFETIAQGLEKYKLELAEYKVFSDQLYADYLRLHGRMSDIDLFISLSTQDERQLTEWNKKITGMEEALGLTKPEVDQICLQVGIRPNKGQSALPPVSAAPSDATEAASPSN